MEGIVLVAGLGNPGDYYARHRHNVGYWFIQLLTERYQVSLKREKKFYGSIAVLQVDQHKIYLFQPDGIFINESGYGLQAVSHFYKIQPQNILVIHDEIDFPVSKVRLKKGGGHAGHNGLRDIIRTIGTDFWRLRVGVGHPGDSRQVNQYVLSDAREKERVAIEAALVRASQFLPALYRGDFTAAMNELHANHSG